MLVIACIRKGTYMITGHTTYLSLKETDDCLSRQDTGHARAALSGLGAGTAVGTRRRREDLPSQWQSFPAATNKQVFSSNGDGEERKTIPEEKIRSGFAATQGSFPASRPIQRPKLPTKQTRTNSSRDQWSPIRPSCRLRHRHLYPSSSWARAAPAHCQTHGASSSVHATCSIGISLPPERNPNYRCVQYGYSFV